MSYHIICCHIICYHNIWQPSTFCHFQLSLCGKYILLGGNCLLHTFIFTLTFCFVLTSAEWLAAIIKTMMMISWIHHSRIGQLDGEKRAMR